MTIFPIPSTLSGGDQGPQTNEKKNRKMQTKAPEKQDTNQPPDKKKIQE